MAVGQRAVCAELCKDVKQLAGNQLGAVGAEHDVHPCDVHLHVKGVGGGWGGCCRVGGSACVGFTRVWSWLYIMPLGMEQCCTCTCCTDMYRTH